MDRWTQEEVCWWLEGQSLGKHKQVFLEQNVTGETLLHLTSEELKTDLQMTALGDRKRLLGLIQKYKTKDPPVRPEGAGDEGSSPQGGHAAVSSSSSDMQQCSKNVRPPPAVQLQPCEVRGLLAARGLDLRRAKASLTDALRGYPDTTSPELVAGEIVDWVKQLRPLHRCKRDVFESMCAHGVLMSVSHMKELEDPDAAVRAAQDHPEIARRLRDLHPSHHRFVKEHVANLVRLEYSCGKAGEAQKSLQDLRSLQIDEPLIQEMAQTAQGVARASLLLKENPESTGIHYHVDERMKTNQHIFSIVGPHTGCYYGDIVLVLKREIMHHPDFFMTVNAATSYHSGKSKVWRPWCDVEDTRDQTFHQLFQSPATARSQRNLTTFERSALHPCVDQWERILAAELASMTAHILQLEEPVQLKDVFKLWSTCDSHTVIEGHLPNVVPLAYVEKILVPADVTISPKTMDVLRSCFGEALGEVLKLGDIGSSDEEQATKTKHGGYPAAFERTLGHAALQQTQLEAHLHGFIVSLPGGMAEKHEEALIPLGLSPGSDLCHLYFSVPAQDTFGNPTELFVTLKTAGAEEFLALNIFLTTSLGKDRISYISKAMPATHAAVLQNQSLRLASAKDFSAGCCPAGQIDYHVQVDAQGKTVTVSHAGLCARLSPSKMEANYTSNLFFSSDLQVSFSSCREAACVTGITVRKESQAEKVGKVPARKSTPTAGGAAKPAKWQWEARKGWFDFEEAYQQKLEDAYTEKKTSVKLTVGDVDHYHVDLVCMFQRSLETGRVRNIRRSSGTREGAEDQEREPDTEGEAEEPMTIWQVKLDLGWEDIGNDVSRMLSQAQAKGKKTARFRHCRMEYEVDFDNMQQTNLRSGRSRDVRKRTPQPQPREERAGVEVDQEQEPDTQTEAEEPMVIWQVKLDSAWEDFGNEVSSMLSQSQARGEKTARFRHRRMEYEVDFEEMRQTNLRSGRSREVRKRTQPQPRPREERDAADEDSAANGNDVFDFEDFFDIQDL